MCLLAPLNREAKAQAVEPETVDVIDLWNHIRNKPDSPATEPDDQKPMKALAPVIGSKPSSGAFGGVAGNVAFFRGAPSTTRISSVVASLTYSAKHQTSATGRFLVFTRGDAWRIEGDNRAQWTSQDTYGLGTATPSAAAVNAKFDFFRIHETVYRQLPSGIFAGLGFHFDNH